MGSFFDSINCDVVGISGAAKGAFLPTVANAVGEASSSLGNAPITEILPKFMGDRAPERGSALRGMGV